jgi:hypothetical protein
MIEEQIKALFSKLADVKYYEEWCKTPAAAFELRTPNEMIELGRGMEVLEVLMKLMKGGYMDGIQNN